MVKYVRTRMLPKGKRSRELDFTDRSPVQHSFLFEGDRKLKDLLCVARERFISPLLKLKYPEALSMGFNIIAKEWGISLQRQRSFCARELDGLSGKTVLVLGCGFGGDAIAWVPYQPVKIIGVDIVNYDSCWRKAISQFSTQNTAIQFMQHDLVADEWSFVAPGSVDIIFSYAVLEHISDLHLLAERANNTLKKGGLFISSYGPLWYGPNGDHTFPQSEDDYFNHLLLSDADYDCYVRRTIDQWLHLENAGEGPFLLERGYFSFLRPEEYLTIFASAGFEIVNSLLNISSAAERYFKKFPDRLSKLKEQYKLKTVDLYANGSTLVLRKR